MSLPLSCFDPSDLTPKVGSFVTIDTWGACGEALLPETWEEADFRISTGLKTIPSLAIKVKVTGRTAQRRSNYFGLWTRIQIEFVGDCEPSTFAPGWMLVRN